MKPALAISLSTVIAVIIGFAMQNLIGNVAGGIILAIVRPVRVGDQITISGSTGCIKDIALIYTVLDTTDGLIYVPSILRFSNVVIKKKIPEDNAQ